MKKFNMQNVFVWIFNDAQKRGYKFRYVNNHDKVYNYLRLQIHNSLNMGWNKEDIIPITNFPFEHMGVKAHEINSKICNWSAFANRMVAANDMIKRGVINDNFWIHDLDTYQLVPFSFPKDCKDVGFTKHAPGRQKPQGASAFYRKEAFDIIDVLSKMIIIFTPKKEESFFPYFYQRAGGQKGAKKYVAKAELLKKKIALMQDKKQIDAFHKKIKRIEIMAQNASKYFGLYEDRFCWLNWTYNLCQQRMFASKYPKSDKPIKVVHFKLENKSTIDCFYKGINYCSTPVVPDSVSELFFKYELLKEHHRR